MRYRFVKTLSIEQTQYKAGTVVAASELLKGNLASMMRQGYVEVLDDADTIEAPEAFKSDADTIEAPEAFKSDADTIEAPEAPRNDAADTIESPEAPRKAKKRKHEQPPQN